METGSSKLANRSREPFSPFPHFPFSPFPHFPVLFTRSLNGLMGQFPLSPFSLFVFSPSYRVALSPFSLVTGQSVAGPLPPRLPGRGRPPPPGDYTPWPLGRRGRSSCRGTLRSSAPLSTAGRQERGSGLGAWVLTIDDCRLMIASRDPHLSPVTCPL